MDHINIGWFSLGRPYIAVLYLLRKWIRLTCLFLLYSSTSSKPLRVNFMLGKIIPHVSEEAPCNSSIILASFQVQIIYCFIVHEWILNVSWLCEKL